MAVCRLAWAAEDTFRCAVLAAYRTAKRRSALRSVTKTWARRTARLGLRRISCLRALHRGWRESLYVWRGLPTGAPSTGWCEYEGRNVCAGCDCGTDAHRVQDASTGNVQRGVGRSGLGGRLVAGIVVVHKSEASVCVETMARELLGMGDSGVRRGQGAFGRVQVVCGIEVRVWTRRVGVPGGVRR